MLTITLFGILFTAMTVFLHTAGTVIWIRYKSGSKRLRDPSRSNPRLLELCGIIGTTACVLLIVHILEVLLWAIAYYSLPAITELKDFQDSVYFSMVTFTSLGYGDIVISSKWKLLSGIQAMAGMLVFGWSSALLFAVLVDVAGLNRSTSQNDQIEVRAQN